MKNLISFFIALLFVFWFAFSSHASEKLPKNIGAFNKYLSSVDITERVDRYSEIIDNIDALIKEVNASKAISKPQKRKLLAQYRVYKSRTQLALKREQKKANINIDMQRIISKNKTNSGIITTINTGSTNSMIVYQQPTQQYQQNTTTPATSTNTSASTQNVTPTTNSTSQTQNTTSLPTYNPKIVIGTSTLAPPDYRNFDVSISEVEIGRFSISASDEDFQIKSLKIENIGNLTLADLFTSNPNIQLIDLERWAPLWRSDCWNIIDWNSIVLQDCNIDPIIKWTKRNLKVVIYPQTIDSSVKKNIQLSTSFSDISLARLSDSWSIETLKITGNVTMNSYIADYAPPNLVISKMGQNQLRVSISNSTNKTLNLKSFEFELSQSNNANWQLLGTICLIIPWSPMPCWNWSDETTSPIQISTNSPSTKTIFLLPTLTYTSTLNQNSQKEIFINISNDSLIMPYNIITAKINSIQYSINGVDYSTNTESWSSTKTTLN
jgi:hypothetical protein